MKVVNLRKDRYTLYIGRAGKGLDGYWGNPVKLNETCPVCQQIHTNRGATLPCYEHYLRERLRGSSAFKQRFMAIDETEVLGCFCFPQPCHGEVMIRVWKEMKNESN